MLEFIQQLTSTWCDHDLTRDNLRFIKIKKKQSTNFKIFMQLCPNDVCQSKIFYASHLSIYYFLILLFIIYFPFT